MSATMTGKSQAKCSICGEVFSRVSNFDRHLVRHRKADGSASRVTCQNPSKVGLRQNARGIWAMPGSERHVSALNRNPTRA